jgi:hypothetical protein
MSVFVKIKLFFRINLDEYKVYIKLSLDGVYNFIAENL